MTSALSGVVTAAYSTLWQVDIRYTMKMLPRGPLMGTLIGRLHERWWRNLTERDGRLWWWLFHSPAWCHALWGDLKLPKAPPDGTAVDSAPCHVSSMGDGQMLRYITWASYSPILHAAFTLSATNCLHWLQTACILHHFTVAIALIVKNIFDNLYSRIWLKIENKYKYIG